MRALRFVLAGALGDWARIPRQPARYIQRQRKARSSQFQQVTGLRFVDPANRESKLDDELIEARERSQGLRRKRQ
jgi:hypothetical protein